MMIWCPARLPTPKASMSLRPLPSLAIALLVSISFDVLLFDTSNCGATERPLDQSPATESDWGYRPDHDTAVSLNPPSFHWRPQTEINRWQLQCSIDPNFPVADTYQADDLDLSVHTPSSTFSPGTYFWRYRGIDASDRKTNWSQARRFTVKSGLPEMPMPSRGDLLDRIPDEHPRLFIRPDDVDRLRELADGPMAEQYAELCRQCDRLLKSPPSTEEPRKYGDDITPRGEQWRELWWGNRQRTIAALRSATTLAFTYRLSGNEAYGDLAKRILMDCAQWDPQGATGYRYNDEAGMPYAYYFSRAYTFIHSRLSDAERRKCQEVMQIRGQEMYEHLCPRHLWSPYASHSNRAWHFLGEVGIAFHGEIDDADQWTWFAANVFFSNYPVWSDDDGGWHEGVTYWNSYISRFTWWADIMKSALRIDAYQKPYFSQIGYYPIYLLPPGKVGGGFGDLNANASSSKVVDLMHVLASQSGNPHWGWYVQQHPDHEPETDYVQFIRGAMGNLQASPPIDLPESRCFAGTGQAMLNTNLIDAKNNVQVTFKSSPFGTQSHGYEANNSFLLWAYGKRLLIRSGKRDMYASDHHKNWMWSTRSVNNITVNGTGQLKRSAQAQAKIVDFVQSPNVDVVVGEAGDCYRAHANDSQSALERFTRAVIFVKPETVVVYDRLVPTEASTLTYWLHAVDKFDIENQHQILVHQDDVHCQVNFLVPEGLKFNQTNQYDPNPRPRIQLREWHLSADVPAEQSTAGRPSEFLTVYRVAQGSDPEFASFDYRVMDDRYELVSRTPQQTVTVQIPQAVETNRSTADAGAEQIQIKVDDPAGKKPPQTFTADLL